MWKSWLKHLSYRISGRASHRPIRRNHLCLEPLEDRAVPSATFTFAHGLGDDDFPNLDEGKSVATDASGNLYVTGYFTNTLHLTGANAATEDLESNGSKDVFVAKYDPSGNLAWATSFGGVEGDEGNDIAVDLNGFVYVTGYFSETVNFGGGNRVANGDTDIFVVKLDGSTGVRVWDRVMGGGADDAGISIAVDISGSVYTTGRFQGAAANFGGPLLSAAAGNDVFVSKLDTDGAAVWARRLGGPLEEVAYGIAVDGDGNVYTTGFFTGRADFNPDEAASATSWLTSTVNGGVSTKDIFISKLDSNGAMQWALQMGGSRDEQANDIAMDSTGNVYITGSFQGTVSFGGTSLTSTGGDDIFVAKVSSSGTGQWARRMGGAEIDVGNSIAVDQAGDVYVTGSFQDVASFGGTSFTSVDAGNDVFFTKLSSNGTYRWTRQVEGSGVDGGFGMAVAGPSDHIYATGSFSKTAAFGTFNLSTPGGDLDIFVTKLRQDVVAPVTDLITDKTLNAAGWTNEAPATLMVTLDPDDDISGVATTQYRIDGGDWMDGPLTFPLTGERSWVIEYYSTDFADNVEAIKTATIGIDITLPTTTHTLPTPTGDDDWHVTAPTLTLTATDATSGVALTQYTIDDGANWIDYTAPVVFTDGSYILKYRSFDVADNEGATIEISFDVDTTTPTTTHTLAGTLGSNGWYTSNVTLTLDATDDTSTVAKTEYSLDGGVSWIEYTAAVPFNVDGTHNVRYRSIDAAGNIEAFQTLDIKIDKTAPTTSHELSGTLGNNDWYTTPVMVTINPEDATSGVAQTVYSLDGGGTWQLYIFDPVTFSTDGTHTIKYRSTDNAGLEQAEQTVVIKIDATDPTTSHALAGTLGSNGWYTSTVTLTLTASDATSGWVETEYSLDAEITWTDYTAPEEFSTDGIHNVLYRSKDAAGNIETPTSVDIKIDTVKPTTSHTLAGSLGSNDWYTSNVTVTLTSSDATSGVDTTEYSLDGSANWQTYSGAFQLNTEGTHTVDYRSIDEAGNVGDTSSFSVKIDKVNPTSSHVLGGTPGSSSWYTTNVEVTLSATDATSGVAEIKYSIDGGTSQTYTAPFTVSGDGTHTIQYYSTDQAGRIESAKGVTLKIDTTEPATSHVLTGTLGNNGWYTSAAQVSLVGSDGTSGLAQTWYRVDGQAWQLYSGTFSVGTTGSHTVEYYSIDNAGKQEAVRSVGVNVDVTDPFTSHSVSGSQGSNGWYTSDVQVTLNAGDAGSGIAQTQYRINGGAWQTYSGAFGIGANGTYTVEYQSTDNAGRKEGVRSFSLTLEDRFVVQGNTLTVQGTAGNDVFTFNVDSSSFLVSINGTYYQASRGAVQNVVFEGGGGADTAYIGGWAANETLWIVPGAAYMTDGSYTLFSNSTEIVAVAGNGGLDVAYAYGSSGNDYLYTAPGVTYLLDWMSYSNAIYGFVSVAAGGNGGTDVAVLYDSAGNDFYAATAYVAVMSDGATYSNSAYGFAVNLGVAGSGGVDVGFLFDTAGVDVVEATGGAYVMYGSGYANGAYYMNQAFIYQWNGAGWSFFAALDATSDLAFTV